MGLSGTSRQWRVLPIEGRSGDSVLEAVGACGDFNASLLLPLPERPHLPSPPPPRQVRRTKARAGSQRTSSTGIPSRVTMSAAAPAGTPASPSARRRAARAASRTAAIESASGRTETVRVESPDIRSHTLHTPRAACGLGGAGARRGNSGVGIARHRRADAVLIEGNGPDDGLIKHAQTRPCGCERGYNGVNLKTPVV